TDWQEKPQQPKSDLASLGIYVFSKKALLAWLDDSRTDFGRDVIPAMLDGGARVFGYQFDGYWQDVGTVAGYWQAHMDLLEEHPGLDLYDTEWLIHTRSEERSPARVGPTASVHRSLISHGCQIWGTVERSVLSPGVRVDPGAVVRDSIVMFDTVIRAGAVVDRAIVDKNVSIGPNAIVGYGSDMTTVNKQEPSRLNTGITVVGKRAVVPAGVRIGRNVKINEGVRPADYAGKRTIASGGTVEAHRLPAGAGTKGGKTSTKARTDGEPMAGRMTASGRSGR
ncbi:MAG: sugar phosphate nucleotidyltransferase, partial [Chloroflexota bacterium]